MCGRGIDIDIFRPDRDRYLLNRRVRLIFQPLLSMKNSELLVGVKIDIGEHIGHPRLQERFDILVFRFVLRTCFLDRRTLSGKDSTTCVL